MPTRGIVLIALGSAQYGRMAGNLAASIRFNDPEVNICVVHSGNSLSHLSSAHMALFTTLVECPAEYYTKKGKTVYLKAKTHLYDLSPYDETIFMDVDLVWLNKKASMLFDELSGVDFTMQNRGYCELSAEKLDENYSMWCNVREVREKYNADGRFYQYASEFIYFKRSQANRLYFEKVKEVFENPLVSTVIRSKGKKIAESFAGDVPDELAFNIASALLNHYPHKENFVPIYWFATEPKMEFNKVLQGYYGYSIGGSVCPPLALQHYGNMVRFYAKKQGLLHYGITNKRNWAPERRLI